MSWLEEGLLHSLQVYTLHKPWKLVCLKVPVWECMLNNLHRGGRYLLLLWVLQACRASWGAHDGPSGVHFNGWNLWFLFLLLWQGCQCCRIGQVINLLWGQSHSIRGLSLLKGRNRSPREGRSGFASMVALISNEIHKLACRCTPQGHLKLLESLSLKTGCIPPRFCYLIQLQQCLQ